MPRYVVERGFMIDRLLKVVRRFWAVRLAIAALLIAAGGQGFLAPAVHASASWTFAEAGDFNGDGKTDIAQFDSSTGQWWVRQSTGSSFTSSVWATLNPAVPWVDVQVGDFNLDGRSDIAVRNLSTGQWWVLLSTGSSFASASLWATWSPAVTWVDVRLADFNGDGRSDIAGRDLNTGQWFVGVSTGSTFTTSLWATWSPAVTWVDVRVGDFTGEGRRSIAGRNLSTGQWYVARTTGSSFFTTLWATWSPAVTWVDVRVADFNGDGLSDIAGRDLSTGQWFVGVSTGTSSLSFTTSLWATWSPAVTWVDVRAGDFNGEGRLDIAGRNLSTGQWYVGRTTGSSFFTTLWATWSPAVTWGPVLVGEFDGDLNAKADIAGFDAAKGQWWVGLSTGANFTTSLWATLSNDKTPPTCALTAVITGPPKQIQITVQDSDGGLVNIAPTTLVNSTVTWAPFAPGTTSPVVVTATKVNQALPSTVALQVTDVAGNVTNCDPTLLSVNVKHRRSSTTHLDGVSSLENKLTVYNDANGLARLKVVVNGKVFNLRLRANEVRSLDLSAALRPGNDNRISITGFGADGSSATVVLANGSPTEGSENVPELHDEDNSYAWP
jgi:hypothetical protein